MKRDRTVQTKVALQNIGYVSDLGPRTKVAWVLFLYPWYCGEFVDINFNVASYDKIVLQMFGRGRDHSCNPTCLLCPCGWAVEKKELI